MKDSEVKILAFVGLFCSLVFLMPILGVLFGALSGLIVGLFFSDTVLGFLSRCGVETAGLQLWQVGAAMGFLGGFLKTSVSRSNK